MAQPSVLSASSRTATGKGAARSLRRSGHIPAVIYGHGREPETLSVEATVFERLLATGTTGNTVMAVSVAGRAPVKAIIREVQRNPIRPADIIHLDLYEVHANERITVDVPVRLVGIAEGVRNFAGVMDHILRELEVHVFPDDIPEHIDLDVTALQIGEGLHVRDLVIPKVEILTDPDQTICTVVAPRVEEAAPGVPEAEVGDEPELIRKAKADEDAAAED